MFWQSCPAMRKNKLNEMLLYGILPTEVSFFVTEISKRETLNLGVRAFPETEEPWFLIPTVFCCFSRWC